MIVYSMIRDQPWYRREAFEGGLVAAGYGVTRRLPDRISPNTALLIWNRYGGTHELALRFESAGAPVLVAENGYLGANGTSPKFDVHPHGPEPHHYYTVERGYHNDSTRVKQGIEDRFARLNVTLKPWRVRGEYILICPNRSFGVPGRMMEVDWAERVALKVRKSTSMPVRIRRHPGNDAPKRALAEDLEGAHAVIIWSSSVGVHALLEGIPVFVDAPYWIMKGASAAGPIDNHQMWELPKREPHFENMAWAQWTLEEIQRGEPFRHLLPNA